MQFSLADSARLTDAQSGYTLDSPAIQRRINQWQTLLQGYDANRVVLTADSSISWILADLACLTAGILLTPLPTYLSETQRGAVLNSLQPDLWLSDHDITDTACTLLEEFDGLLLYRRQVNGSIAVARGTQKITFTSGSTGNPKGVCLSARSQLDVALALKALVEHISSGCPRHLCLLPLSTLLENIAGVYTPLLAGGEVIVARDIFRGFSGSRLTDPLKLLQLITTQQPKSLILVPELLKMLIQAANSGWAVPASLEFIAVGGAYVSPDLLRKAAALKLPVYQGYGLSECGSVVALSDTDPAKATETVGQPLACRDVHIINGELVVNTPFLGYLGDADSSTAQVYTGDLAEWTAQGELRILGRRKNLIINSFGRNISPEWVETALTDSGVVQQAMLLGDAKPYCSALLFASAGVSDTQLAEIVQKVNKQLPDYATVVSYHRLTDPFTAERGMLTENGRLRRKHIEQCYAAQISALFTGDKYELLSIPA
ncbi:AMP-binding protein [Rheinheimera sp. YQF-2]|uniref:AMP-binding protein n=1 Tax=Rheinheimera lutimaris TaxID=2740584 RepID=A0A7Y5AP30_9GAMM|nr:AMP-binding protein [Rheinheimera lutimaris]NRQ41903.1 AMP-binding protein [Rheinheimera lutimaris]